MQVINWKKISFARYTLEKHDICEFYCSDTHEQYVYLDSNITFSYSRILYIVPTWGVLRSYLIFYVFWTWGGL